MIKEAADKQDNRKMEEGGVMQERVNKTDDWVGCV